MAIGWLTITRFEVVEAKDSSISLESVSIAEPDGTTGEITIAGSAVTGVPPPADDGMTDDGMVDDGTT